MQIVWAAPPAPSPPAAPSPPVVTVDAAVDADLRTVRGTLVLPGALAEAALVDPLAALPEPGSDLQSLRTYPGAPSRGSVTWTRDGDTVAFVARLPRRFGTIGATRRGLFGLGGWYPQPVTPEGLPIVTWQVQVALPEGAGGAVGDVAGVGTLTWSGPGERVGLAVVPRPVFTPLDGPSDVLVVSRGRPRRSLVRPLERTLVQVRPPLDAVVAVAPLRRRLTGDAPGLALISDRAFRLTPGLRFVHRMAAIRGVAEASAPQADPLDRELAGAAVASAWDARQRSLDTNKLLTTFSWVPQIDALLASERMPFYSEVLGRTWPADPVRDDLAELFDPHAPGTAVLVQLDDTFGAGTGQAVGLALAAGDDASEALRAARVDPGWIAPWRRAVPPQDYVLAVRDGAVTVGRLAPPDAPPETVIVRVDGIDHPLQLAPGYSPLPELGAPRRVTLDPAGHVSQTSRRGDSWPRRYDWTASAWLASIDLSQGIVYAGAWVTLRRQYDTQNLWTIEASNSRANLVSASVSYFRKEGRLLDAFARPHRIRMEVGASVLDPTFAATFPDAAPGGAGALQVGLDGALGWALDDRVSSDFPLRGRRVGAAFTGGGIPGTATTWIGATASALQVASFHPRWAVAVETGGAVAQSDLPHRLLSLGGPSALRSVPTLPACPSTADACLPVADARGVVRAELRAAAIRGASLPMLLAWGSELQLAVGVEALVAHLPAARDATWGLGLTAGALGLAEIFGTQSSGLGFTAAWRAVAEGPGLNALAPSLAPEISVRFSQTF